MECRDAFSCPLVVPFNWLRDDPMGSDRRGFSGERALQQRRARPAMVRGTGRSGPAAHRPKPIGRECGPSVALECRSHSFARAGSPSARGDSRGRTVGSPSIAYDPERTAHAHARWGSDRRGYSCRVSA